MLLLSPRNRRVVVPYAETGNCRRDIIILSVHSFDKESALFIRSTLQRVKNKTTFVRSNRVPTTRTRLDQTDAPRVPNPSVRSQWRAQLFLTERCSEFQRLIYENFGTKIQLMVHDERYSR